MLSHWNKNISVQFVEEFLDSAEKLTRQSFSNISNIDTLIDEVSKLLIENEHEISLLNTTLSSFRTVEQQLKDVKVSHEEVKTTTTQVNDTLISTRQQLNMYKEQFYLLNHTYSQFPFDKKHIENEINHLEMLLNKLFGAFS
ncbi:hypothetical protein DPMN_134115 [Dreissena polymorpha]|uniref:Uncharacterized protein n=1 Tax=Dreissena polymorpha TaxID=45954 RepID=A0A9D4JAF2_DREPO|nr:hypothetical protein DPMN_134115 [Dreissena polymorpha]